MTIQPFNAEDPIIISDDAFYEGEKVSIFDDKMFVYDKVFNMNRNEWQVLQGREDTTVVAEYEDNYIISEDGGQGSFDKISKSEYLAG